VCSGSSLRSGPVTPSRCSAAYSASAARIFHAWAVRPPSPRALADAALSERVRELPPRAHRAKGLRPRAIRQARLPDRSGISPGRSNVHRAVAWAADAAGLVPDGAEPVGLHDLRHAFASYVLIDLQCRSWGQATCCVTRTRTSVQRCTRAHAGGERCSLGQARRSSGRMRTTHSRRVHEKRSCLVQRFPYGRYWARTSDPQLVDPIAGVTSPSVLFGLVRSNPLAERDSGHLRGD
jgi:hypothetical protein